MFFALISGVKAVDSGVFGETFAVAEDDLSEYIFGKLRELQKSGVLSEKRAKIEARIRETILHPQAVNGLKTTENLREYKFDPSIVASRDLTNQKGEIFVKKGQKFNPLDKLQWSKILAFIDGTNDSHISWACDKNKNSNDHLKIILVNGSPIEFQKKLNKEIFFDQHGVLIRKFGIRQVPAIVFQKKGEKVLTIREEKP